MMIADISATARRIMEALSGRSKAPFFSDALIARSISRLEEHGIPTSRNEDYKYCNIDAVLKKDFASIAQDTVAAKAVSRLEKVCRIVFVNGQHDASQSDPLPKGVTCVPLAEGSIAGTMADPSADAFIALNTAFPSGGTRLHIEGEIGSPLHVVYVSACKTAAIVNPRVLVEVADRAQVTIVEEFSTLATGRVFLNFVSEKRVGDGARVVTCTLQDGDQRSYGVYTTQVELGSAAEYTNTTVTLGGQLTRNNHNVVMRGERCGAHLYGLFLANGTALVDNHTLMDHQLPNCESNELYKGLAGGRATGVFNGKIFVRRDAQKTNAYQSSKNILLSDEATINTKPQLEIYADDVKCSHGTSTGRIDEEALFYLNARGISHDSAQRMLMASFANEVIDRLPLEELRNKLLSVFESKILQQ